MKAITITLCNRPEYARRALEAMSQCVGIEEYIVLPFVEPVNDEVVALAKNIKFAEAKPTINPRKLGCALNTYSALTRGFEISEYVIHTEEDHMFAPDALRYFEHCERRYGGDPEIYTVSCYNRWKCREDEFYEVLKKPAFICTGWATWRDRWAEPGGMKEDWDYGYKYGGWDFNMSQRLRKTRLEVYPILSRIQNIGAEGGIHTPSVDWHMQNVHSEFWAGDPSIRGRIVEGAGRWRELEGSRP